MIMMIQKPLPIYLKKRYAEFFDEFVLVDRYNWYFAPFLAISKTEVNLTYGKEFFQRNTCSGLSISVPIKRAMIDY